MDETILADNELRFVMFPIKYNKGWKMYKEAISNFWTAEEISFSDDVLQWTTDTKITQDDKKFIINVLAFFAASDGIVIENLAIRFMKEVQIPELRAFYGFQIAIENIHSEVYSLLIDNLISDQKQKDETFRAIQTYPIIKKMAEWTTKWINSDKPFAQRLLAFICVEGILFSGPFCAIFWLKKRGLLPALTFSNELISRDEGLHTKFGCYIYTDLLEHKESYEKVIEIMKECVELEIEFINDSIPCNLLGMNATSMEQYIKYVGNKILEMLEYKHYWDVQNPYPWMDLISCDVKTNFFEKRVSEYARANFNVVEKNVKLLDDF